MSSSAKAAENLERVLGPRKKPRENIERLDAFNTLDAAAPYVSTCRPIPG